ncbi:MAG: cell wall hydrolase [Rhizomicrobium sp.]
MTKKTADVLLRSDRVLVVALAVVLAAASAAVGAAANNHPGTEQATAVGVLPAAPRPATTPAGAAPVQSVTPESAPGLRGAADVAAVQPASVEPSIAATVTKTATSTDMAMAQLLAEHRCLSEVMYYEARGEGVEGQMAVAEVIFHRLRHGNFGHSICGVVYQGAETSSCQFSFACHGELAQRKSPAAWRTTEILAARILAGQVALQDVTGGATYFHAASVSPGWGDNMERTAQIGNHIFYKRTRSRDL